MSNIIEFKMARKKNRRNKPTDPAEIARLACEARKKAKNPENWGLNVEAAALPANAGIVHEAETRENEERAHRYDVFGLLASRKRITKLEEQTVRDLQDLMAIRMLISDPARAGGYRVDNGTKDATDAAIRAGRRIDATLKTLKPLNAALLAALCVPFGRVNWKQVAKRVTGLVDAHALSKSVVVACRDLADHGIVPAPSEAKSPTGQISLGEMNGARDAA